MSYNKNAMAAYQQYGQTMTASGGGRNMSGLGARSSTSSMTSVPDGPVDFTTIDTKTGKQTKVATIKDYGSDNDDGPTVLYTKAANAATAAGVDLVKAAAKPSVDPKRLYSEPRFNIEQQATKIEDYLRGTAVQDALIEAQGFEKPYTGLYVAEDRPMTEAELQKYKPLIDMADDIMNENITVEELGDMDREDQEAFLRAIGVQGLGPARRDTVFVDGEFDVASTQTLAEQIEARKKWDRILEQQRIEEQKKAEEEEGVVDATASVSSEAKDLALVPTRATTPASEKETTEEFNERRRRERGLMSRPEGTGELAGRILDGKDGDLSIPTQYGTAVFEMSTDLKVTEGTEPHIGSDWENVTLALGIVPTSGLKIDGKVVPRDRATRGKWLKRNGYVDKNNKPTKKFEKANIDTSGAVKDGVRRSDYSSDTAWSAAVIDNFKQGAQEKVKDFDELGVDEQKAVIDLAWNMGVGGLDYTGNKSLIKELSKAPQDRDIPNMLEAGKHVTEGGKVMRGLARRKALAINELIDDPAEKITKIRQLSVGSKTYHTYINAVGEEVKTIKLGQKHSGSPDGIIDVATGDEVVAQEDLDYSSVVVRPKLRPTK